MRPLLKFLPGLATAAVIALLGSSTDAKANVITIAVQNGSFENVAVSTGGVANSNQLGYMVIGSSTLQQATGWTNNSNASGQLGYNFVFNGNSTTAVTGPTAGQYGSAFADTGGKLGMWGAGNTIGLSPDGGNFLALDGAYHAASISQVLTGLTVGMDTKVSFYFAGAQQYGYDGPTTESFQVSLTDAGANTTQTDTTAVLNNVTHGFTGWQFTTVDFFPTSTTETLSFLAVGTPSGVPPFSLLDGVSVVQVTPEPSTLALLGTGVLAVGGLLRRRRVTSSL